MLQDFQNILLTSISLSQVIGSITVALFCSLFISYIYRWTYIGTGYSTSYIISLVAFAMITSIVIMVIGNNLARAFGLVGSMAIIRFRLAIRDTQDIVFIFFALAAGLAAGVGLYMIAITGTIFIGIVLLLLSKSNFSSTHKREYLLQFDFASDDSESSPYLDIMKKYCKKYKLVNIKSSGNTDIVVLSYYIKLWKKETGREFIHKIGSIEGISNINFFFDKS